MPESCLLFPEMQTARLRLVEHTPHHAAGLFTLFTDERVTRYYMVFPFTQAADLLPVIIRFKSMHEAGQGIRWAITTKGTGELIGTIGFTHYSRDHKGTVVFALLPAYWGNGYIPEALAAVMQYGSDALGIRRIEAEVMPGNAASVGVLQKCGFSYEGLLRNWLLWNEAYYDMEMYSFITT